MKVELNFDKCYCRVTKEQGDPKFSGYNAESTFLYHVKKELIKQGYDMIKTRMCKDGNMTAELHQYVRSRYPCREDSFAVFNDRYAIVDAGKEFTKNGEFDLWMWKL